MTDVINGVPRSLLEQVTIELEHDTDRYMLGRELRKILATAQPAADGERGADKWADYKKKFCGCHDASRLNSCHGLANCQLPANHPERKKPAAHPRQAVAVTDEVRKLREALEDLLGCPHNIVQATVPKAGIEAAPPYQVVMDVSVSLTRWRKAQAALSAHKTGEEE